MPRDDDRWCDDRFSPVTEGRTVAVNHGWLQTAHPTLRQSVPFRPGIAWPARKSAIHPQRADACRGSARIPSGIPMRKAPRITSWTGPTGDRPSDRHEMDGTAPTEQPRIRDGWIGAHRATTDPSWDGRNGTHPSSYRPKGKNIAAHPELHEEARKAVPASLSGGSSTGGAAPRWRQSAPCRPPS